MTTKRNGTFEPKIVRPSFLQLWKHKCQKLWRRLQNLQQGPQSNALGPQGVQGTPLNMVRGGKVELKSFDSKSHTYNPREFRTNKGPRK